MTLLIFLALMSIVLLYSLFSTPNNIKVLRESKRSTTEQSLSNASVNWGNFSLHEFYEALSGEKPTFLEERLRAQK